MSLSSLSAIISLKAVLKKTKKQSASLKKRAETKRIFAKKKTHTKNTETKRIFEQKGRYQAHFCKKKTGVITSVLHGAMSPA